MQRTFPLESSYFIYNDLNHFARALFLRLVLLWKSNSILPTQMGYAERGERETRKRIFARMTAELLYANAGAERRSNNFTVARCTWSCDKVTENIAGASERRFYFFYCLLHMFGSEIKRIDSFLFAEKYFLPRFATTGAENKIAWVPAVADFMRREILFLVLCSWTVLPQPLEKIYYYVGCHCNDKCSIGLMSDGTSETKSAQSWAALKLAWKCRRQRNICMRWNRKLSQRAKRLKFFAQGAAQRHFT